MYHTSRDRWLTYLIIYLPTSVSNLWKLFKLILNFVIFLLKVNLGFYSLFSLLISRLKFKYIFQAFDSSLGFVFDVSVAPMVFYQGCQASEEVFQVWPPAWFIRIVCWVHYDDKIAFRVIQFQFSKSVVQHIYPGKSAAFFRRHLFLFVNCYHWN